MSPLQRLRAELRQLIINKRHARGIDVARQILSIVPDDAKAHRQMASCLSYERRLDEALAIATVAIGLDPMSEIGHATLGDVHRAREEFDEALASYLKSLEIKPKYQYAIQSVASVSVMKGDWPMAMEWADRGLALDPANEHMLRVRGLGLAVEGRADEALAIVEQVLRIAPELFRVHVTVSDIYRRLGRNEDAEHFARTALAMAPADPKAHNDLARLKLRLQKYDEAQQHFQEADNVYQSRPDDRKGSKQIEIGSLLGQAAVNSSKRLFREAEAQYRRILEIDPDHVVAMALVAVSMGSQNHFEPALALAREAVRLKPDLPTARMILGALLIDTEQFDEALDQATALLKTQPAAAEPHQLFTGVYLMQDDFSRALDHIDTALKVRQDQFIRRSRMLALAGLGDPRARTEIEVILRDDAETYGSLFGIGHGFYLLGEYDRAEDFLLRAMAIDPSGLGGHGRMGLLYHRQGLFDKARPLLEKALSLNPHQRKVTAALADIDGRAATAAIARDM